MPPLPVVVVDRPPARFPRRRGRPLLQGGMLRPSVASLPLRCPMLPVTCPWVASGCPRDTWYLSPPRGRVRDAGGRVPWPVEGGGGDHVTSTSVPENREGGLCNRRSTPCPLDVPGGGGGKVTSTSPVGNREGGRCPDDLTPCPLSAVVAGKGWPRQSGRSGASLPPRCPPVAAIAPWVRRGLGYDA